MIAMIAAMAANRVIGRDGKIPWHLPEDMERFRRRTMGHVVVMGRRTWEEIGHPLPGRMTYLVSSRLHIKEENQIKIDRLVKIFRLFAIYPALKESGLLGGDLFGIF